MEHKKTMTYGGGNPGPRLGQAQKMAGCKYSTKNNGKKFWHQEIL